LAVVRLLARALERLTGRGPVIVPEYRLSPRARYGWDGQEPIVAVREILEGWLEEHLEQVARELAELADWCRSVPRHGGPRDPRWENDWWGSLDAVWQVATLRERDSARYVEVGSGQSTLFARRAIDDFGLRTRIVSVDPAPRLDVEWACDEVVRQPLEDSDLSMFSELAPGDVVLVDGSHVVTMNSDSVVFFLEVLPSLPAGVLVGIDDVYLPWDYHSTWADRWYGEQYLLAAYILGGGGHSKIAFPGWVAAQQLASEPLLEPLWHVIENRSGRLATSFWIESPSDAVKAQPPP
jgi:Methyltransferase domain